MASQSTDECDGVFLDRDASYDEVDASRILEIVRVRDIPFKYFRRKIFAGSHDTSHGFQRASERPPKYRVVHKDFGSRLSPLMDSFGSFGLITFEEGKHTETEVTRFAHWLAQVIPAQASQPFRWSPRHLVMYFANSSGYETLGKHFIDGKLDKYEEIAIRKIEPAVIGNPPRCFLEIEAVACDIYFQTLVSAISPFSASFPFLQLREATSGNSNADTSPSSAMTQNGTPITPAVSVSLMFDGNNQSRAAKSLRSLQSNGWQPLMLPGPVAKALDDGLHYFVHETLRLPMFAVKTGTSQSGIQLTLFVQDYSKFSLMEDFYRSLLGVKPFDRTIPEGPIRYSILPMSSRSELVLTHFPGFLAQSLKNATLNIRVDDVSHIKGIIKVCSGHWHMNDPEGNRILLFRPLK